MNNNKNERERRNAIGKGVRAFCAEFSAASDRAVFGQNRGVRFPTAEARIEIEATGTMRWRACEESDAGRKLRETHLCRMAPISTNLIQSYVSERLLDLPRSVRGICRG
ncbi:hypothetical protein [Stutzerimonas azotifigens]|uniref:hypothetical protein n=1 Tax=Stutzerimonas azotifigens TaxID=291995 RepID=UPI0038B4D0C9